MAQNEGKKFEEDWKNSFKKVNAYFFRIKDSAASFSGGNSSFTRSNPYDCFVLYEGYFFPMSQIHGLEEVDQFKNVYAGFIFNFRNTNNTYYLNIKNFMDFYNNTSKFSINEKDVIEYDGVLVDSKILKVRYRYNVEKLLKQIISE